MKLTVGTPDDIAKELGRRLKTARMLRGISQRELATNAGLSASTISALEMKGRGSIESLIRLAVAVGLHEDVKALFKLTVRSIAAIERSETRKRKRQRAA